MKVKIRKPVNWFGPYQLAEALCFWAKKEKDEIGFNRSPDWVHDFGTFLAGDKHDTVLTKTMQWIHSFRQKLPWNKDVVKIDYWDSWSCDYTLSPIILPLLKQLKETKHGYGWIEDEDVPKHLQSWYALPKDNLTNPYSLILANDHFGCVALNVTIPPSAFVSCILYINSFESHSAN